MGTMIKRYLLVYLRDRVSVFFSLLSILITVGLYILFLAELQIDSINKIFGDMISENSVSAVVHTWIISGLLSIIPITSSLGALGTMVYDRERKRIRDYIISPQNRLFYPISAIVSACLVGLFMSLVGFALYSIYMYIDCGVYFTAVEYLKAVLLIVYAALLSATFMGFVVSFLKTGSSFAALSIVVGTLIGFLTGIYVPVGILPTGIQYIVKFFPFAHVGLLFRNLLMNDSLEQMMNELPAQISGNEMLSEYKKLYGVEFFIGDHLITPLESALAILVVIFISAILFFFNYNRKKNQI